MTAQAVDLRDGVSQKETVAVSLSAGPRIFPLVLFVVGAVALFFAMIYLRVSLDQAAFELDGIETEISVQESLQLDLRYDLAGLQDPTRIVLEAERIGLKYPSERVTISLTRSVGASLDPVAGAPLSALSGEQP